MLLTLTTTARPATDLGYLLHKNPARVQTFELSFGKAHVFYPEAQDDRCTMALLLDVDPVGLVRGRSGPSGEGGALAQYVNDRPFVASSFVAVAIARIFGTALSGRSKERPDLSARALPFEVRLPVLPCRGGELFLRKLFEPLGYALEATSLPLDETVPSWGASRYFAVVLRGEQKLSDLLSHLYVLIPVLDDDKHYWVGDEEIEKLVRHGEGWLATHPEKENIAHRYLAHQKRLVTSALEQLVADEDPRVEEEEIAHGAEEAALERRLSLNEQRLDRVAEVLASTGARRVVDLGCGEGRLLRVLLKKRTFAEIVGMDVSHRSLTLASERMKLERMPELQRQRVKLLHGSLMYRDARLAGYDAASVVEVIEHLDPPRLAAFERVVFECARPGAVVVTTPNAEYNVRFENLPAGKFRHRVWHMETLAKVCRADPGLLVATPYKVVEVADDAARAEAARWWEELTGRGGEGMVVKPLEFAVRGRRGLLQPAVKCRGPEYLRIIYGPEYTLPEHLERLRSRGLSTKRSLALREFALGIEALERFVRREPLRRVHECMFGVLALESEPVDPRL